MLLTLSCINTLTKISFLYIYTHTCIHKCLFSRTRAGSFQQPTCATEEGHRSTHAPFQVCFWRPKLRGTTSGAWSIRTIQKQELWGLRDWSRRSLRCMGANWLRDMLLNGMLSKAMRKQLQEECRKHHVQISIFMKPTICLFCELTSCSNGTFWPHFAQKGWGVEPDGTWDWGLLVAVCMQLEILLLLASSIFYSWGSIWSRALDTPRDLLQLCQSSAQSDVHQNVY